MTARGGGGGILALDVAKVTGWALWRPGLDLPEWGEEKFRPRRDQDGAQGSQALGWLAELLVAQPALKLVVYEMPHVRHGRRTGERADSLATLRPLIGLAAVMAATARHLGREVAGFDVHAVRKSFVGKMPAGRDAAKAAVMAACRYRGWDTKGRDNPADALALLDHASAVHGVAVPWRGTAAARMAGARR